MTGFFLVASLATSTNLGPSTMSSRYKQITLVLGSFAAISMKSASLRSDLFPKLTNWLNPRPVLRLQSKMAKHRAPLWDINAMLPLSAIFLAKVALKGVWVSMTPRQLGPTILIPYLRAISTSFSSSSRPSFPISLKPAVITIMCFTPALPHSSATGTDTLAGTQSTATSMGCLTSKIEGYALIPQTSGSLGLMG